MKGMDSNFLGSLKSISRNDNSVMTYKTADHIYTVIFLLVKYWETFAFTQNSLECGFKDTVGHAVSAAVLLTVLRIVRLVGQKHQVYLQ